MTQTSGSLITRNYNQFRGVDFSNRKDEVNIYRSPDALNMWKNYRNSNGKCIETRPDVALLKEYSNPIFGLFFYDSGMLVHSGTNLYDGDTLLYSSMAEHKSNYFVFNNLIYIMDGTNYLQFDGTSVTAVTGYVPTTSISRSPLGGGVIYEDVNFLSDYRVNSFCADGENTEYHLDSQNLDNEAVHVWILNEEGQKEEVTEGFSTNYTDGIVTFETAPEVPLTDGEDNVFIRYKKTVSGYANTIKNCTLVELFDNRVFVSGNDNYPNKVWHCSLNDPTYFSDLDYYEEGEVDSKVKSMVAGNNALWVLKSPSKSNTSIFYHNPTIDSTYGKIYPSVHSSISTGCKTIGLNFNDTICFYSENGLEAITSDVTTEQVISHKSSLVDSRLLNETHYDNMILEEWEGYLLTIIDNKIYLADSRQFAQINDHYEYEWYYFELDQKITSTRVKNGVLYLATEETKKVNGVNTTYYRIYTLTNTGDREVEAYWTTIEDEFNYPQYQKITNKKGCVVDISGEKVSIYAKTDNKEFDFIKTFSIKKGYVVPRIKKKKWKSIQLMFYSTLPFSLYSSTLESYIGSYIKR